MYMSKTDRLVIRLLSIPLYGVWEYFSNWDVGGYQTFLSIPLYGIRDSVVIEGWSWKKINFLFPYMGFPLSRDDFVECGVALSIPLYGINTDAFMG